MFFNKHTYKKNRFRVPVRLFRNITEDVKIYLKLKSGTRGTAARVTDRIQLFKNLSPFKNFQHSPCNYLAVKSSKQRLNMGDSIARIRKNRRHSQVLHFLTNLPLFSNKNMWHRKIF